MYGNVCLTIATATFGEKLRDDRKEVVPFEAGLAGKTMTRRRDDGFLGKAVKDKPYKGTDCGTDKKD